jgi:maltose alpha-D-glucosyltransferase/alpha-amylase
MREMIRVRKTNPAFGRGEMRLLEPANQAVLAYLRSYDDATILVVNNLSPDAQSVELELTPWAGAQPIDLFSGERLSTLTVNPYRLELRAYGYRWLQVDAPKKESRGG